MKPFRSQSQPWDMGSVIYLSFDWRFRDKAKPATPGSQTGVMFLRTAAYNLAELKNSVHKKFRVQVGELISRPDLACEPRIGFPFLLCNWNHQREMCGRNCRWSAKLEIFVVQLFMETLDDSCVCVGGASAGCLSSFKTHCLRVFKKQ